MFETKPTFSNTLQYKIKGMIPALSVIDLQEMALKLGYSYYMWNDRIYITNSNVNHRIQTQYTLKDLL
jgi:hypothetical protein